LKALSPTKTVPRIARMLKAATSARIIGTSANGAI
jgi:hypothetical protein